MTETIVPFRKAPARSQENSETAAGWQILLAMATNIHALIIQGVLSGTFQKHEAGPTIAAGAALLAAYDDTDVLLRVSAAFIRIYGCDPYSFATRLSQATQDRGGCESVTL